MFPPAGWMMRRRNPCALDPSTTAGQLAPEGIGTAGLKIGQAKALRRCRATTDSAEGEGQEGKARQSLVLIIGRARRRRFGRLETLGDGQNPGSGHAGGGRSGSLASLSMSERSQLDPSCSTGLLPPPPPPTTTTTTKQRELKCSYFVASRSDDGHHDKQARDCR